MHLYVLPPGSALLLLWTRYVVVVVVVQLADESNRLAACCAHGRRRLLAMATSLIRGMILTGMMKMKSGGANSPRKHLSLGLAALQCDNMVRPYSGAIAISLADRHYFFLALSLVGSAQISCTNAYNDRSHSFVRSFARLR